jgi:carboxylesterase
MESPPPAAIQQSHLSPAFSFIKGPLGCLLIHGFGDTADLMEPMAAFLNSEDISVRGMTLPGHGSSLEEFAKITNQQLLAAVEAEYQELRKSCESVVVVGFSMGGLLALQLGTLRELDGIAAICTPMFPRGGPAGEKAIRLASKVGGTFGLSLPKMGITSLADKTLSERMTGHEKYPFRSVSRLIDLMETTRPVLRRVNAPLLILQAKRDDVIWKKSGEYLLDAVGSKTKKLVHLENSRHKAPIDSDRHTLFEEIRKFGMECAKE